MVFTDTDCGDRATVYSVMFLRTAKPSGRESVRLFLSATRMGSFMETTFVVEP